MASHSSWPLGSLRINHRRNPSDPVFDLFPDIRRKVICHGVLNPVPAPLPAVFGTKLPNKGEQVKETPSPSLAMKRRATHSSLTITRKPLLPISPLLIMQIFALLPSHPGNPLQTGLVADRQGTFQKPPLLENQRPSNKTDT
jgi:hypothetical protein